MKISHLSISLLILCLAVSFGCKKDKSTTVAEVKSTTISVTSWSYTSPYHHVNLEVPELTSDKLNTAAVMVYFKANGTGWTALPFTQYNNSGSNYFMGFSTTEKNVQVTWVYNTSLSQGQTPNEYYGVDAIQFKIVIIPESTARLSPDLDLKDYYAVKERFDLE